MEAHADTVTIDAASNAVSTRMKGRMRLVTLDALDGRTRAARRAHELIEAIETDLGGGDRLSEGSRQLVQRAAVLGTFIESCEAQWLSGETVELADYLAAINSQRRVLATIGLQRRAKDVSPSLGELMLEDIAERRREAEEAAKAAAKAAGESNAPTAAEGADAEAPTAGDDAMADDMPSGDEAVPT
jgi:hypothetical protein